MPVDSDPAPRLRRDAGLNFRSQAAAWVSVPSLDVEALPNIPANPAEGGGGGGGAAATLVPFVVVLVPSVLSELLLESLSRALFVPEGGGGGGGAAAMSVLSSVEAPAS